MRSSHVRATIDSLCLHTEQVMRSPHGQRCHGHIDTAKQMLEIECLRLHSEQDHAVTTRATMSKAALTHSKKTKIVSDRKLEFAHGARFCGHHTGNVVKAPHRQEYALISPQLAS